VTRTHRSAALAHGAAVCYALAIILPPCSLGGDEMLDGAKFGHTASLDNLAEAMR
jgi:hypothetical protein